MFAGQNKPRRISYQLFEQKLDTVRYSIMWVVIPVKALKDAKLRLNAVLSSEQRAQLSYFMLNDILETLSSSEVVEGITLISSDSSVESLANRYQAGFLSTDVDSGYSSDAMQAISKISLHYTKTIAIIPSDVPRLSLADLSHLDSVHDKGITLCPAIIDGGTNGLLFEPPLRIPLLFGVNSLSKYESAALEKGLAIKTELIEGLKRDIDRPEDLRWLVGQKSGGQAWAYIRSLGISI